MNFDHSFLNTELFAEKLDVDLEGSCYRFQFETHQKMRDIEKWVRYTSKLMREVEWLYSEYLTEKGFMQRVAEIEKEKPKS